MNNNDQKVLTRFLEKIERDGIPLSGRFEVGVVLAHAELAFKAGLRLGRKRKTCEWLWQDATRNRFDRYLSGCASQIYDTAFEYCPDCGGKIVEVKDDK